MLSPVSHIDDILAFCSLLIIVFSVNTNFHYNTAFGRIYGLLVFDNF